MKLNKTITLSEQLDAAISRVKGTKFEGSQPLFALTPKLLTRLAACEGEMMTRVEIGHAASGMVTMPVRMPLSMAWIFRGHERCLLHISGAN